MLAAGRPLSAEVTSICPTTGHEIRQTVSPDRVQRAEPKGTAIAFRTTGKARCAADIGGAVCRHANVFRSAAAAGATTAVWPAGEPDMMVLSVEQAFELGRLRNRVAFPEILAA